MVTHRNIPCNDTKNINILSKLCINGSNWDLDCVPNSGQHEGNDGMTYSLRVTVGIWCILVALVGIFGNLLTLFALPHAKKNRIGNKAWSRYWNTSTVFIINLARIDLIFCIVCMPTFIIPFLTQSWEYGYMPCNGNPLVPG